LKPESYSQEELLTLVARLTELVQQRELHVPASIFSTQLSPAEALVKHLKEDKHLRYTEIAKLLNRDQRGLWSSYKRAQEKQTRPLPLWNEHLIPISTFKNRQLSILEHVVHHLRGKGMAVKDIGKLLNKSPSTIAAVHHRVRRKL